MPAPAQQLTFKGRKVPVTNLEKVLYPATGFRKADVIDYYVRIAPVLLPHLKNRPVTLKRYPDGVEGEFFYEKRCPDHAPEWVKTVDVPRESGKEPIDYCLINDVPTLAWVANLAALELHPFLHRAPALLRPTAVMFDLDPGPPADIRDCCRLALEIRKELDALGLTVFAKSSGSKGLQLVVPLNSPCTYEKTKSFALQLAQRMEQRLPKLVVSKMAKALRGGKVFIDWSQNDDHKTTVAVYSLRARTEPAVSTPVTWDEVTKAGKASRGKPLVFSPSEALERVERDGDIFADVLTLKQRLPALE